MVILKLLYWLLVWWLKSSIITYNAPKTTAYVKLQWAKSQNPNSSKNRVFFGYFSEFLDFFSKNHTEYGKLSCKTTKEFLRANLESLFQKIQGLRFSSTTTPCYFSPNFMQFVQFCNEYIFIWVKEHFWSTFGREHSIWNRVCKEHGNNYH